jgi:hypothetical protein
MPPEGGTGVGEEVTIGMKARVFRLGVTVAAIAMLIAVLGAGKKW